MAIWDDVIPDADRKMFDKMGDRGHIDFGQRPALIVVDMTYNFADSRYPPGNSEMGKPAVAAIRRLLDAARSASVPVFYTVGVDSTLPGQRGRWKTLREDPLSPDLPPKNAVVEEIAPQEGEFVIPKMRPSAFFGTNLVDLLIYQQIDTTIVTGMTTSGCVRATVVDAFSYNYRVIIPEEGVGDRALLSHKVSLYDMHMKYADVLPVRAVLDYLVGLKSQQELAVSRR
ncbi:MAG: isochorismatase family protein [Chloroflexi bacterium]|nr:isochorismatase family protein [Chloroflexota bacterium]